ncbi:cell envelope-related function transcriptional attenuator common domain-containing protein [Halanaerobium congolense]|jgi:LCP family protein required for cell wall assembly|uniref:Cell envelope-related function transcriptional attenuator common domain-containing protein n=1 Tax=Halanaerobium congolense TaxID=54121 RepID=A0A1G6KB76_9FIRM|nr:LCP family protein [Halanaerobium congolense]PTX17671.1 LytR family transcriptional attenuator [Halanaerobium congolense]PXV66717.1 LytR family transcriptional attenuator [Halanaerobium congolense]SDC28187.1 cell envelope-related function transcriptional attenuator common domain-containing protein [Halanaerobium congolense]SDF82032.1 cell envelope-related function transcriptional attenuator common domain-containing protein [Halanaerobium congolense]SDH16664.1 cell envelope-related function 
MLEKLTDWKYIALIIFLVIIGVIMAFLWNDELTKISSEGPFAENKVNILAVGYDSNINGASRADTIILISLDVDSKEAGLIFLPRDTYINSSKRNFTKLNSAHVYGGIELTQKTIEEMLKIDIDYYLETDFKGFEKIIDRLGGVNVNVSRHLNYVDKAGGLYINIPAGQQNLNGKKALQYVRYRDERGDIGRIERQQKFVDAVFAKVLSPAILTKIPGIIKEVNDTINTNIPIQDITPFINMAKEIDLSQIETKMLPGEPKYINGISYWVPDLKEANIMVENLVRNKSYIKNKDYQLTVLNGVGDSGAASNTAKLLEKYGFKIDEIGNADNYNYEHSIIEYYSKDDEETASQIAELLSGEIEYVEDSGEHINKNIKVIVGSGYKKSV